MKWFVRLLAVGLSALVTYAVTVVVIIFSIGVVYGWGT